MIYDLYGNCTKIQYPSHSITIGYENTVHTYPEYVTNDFGDTSWRLDYDFRYGIPLKTIDIYGNEMHYTLEELEAELAQEQFFFSLTLKVGVCIKFSSFSHLMHMFQPECEGAIRI